MSAWRRHQSVTSTQTAITRLAPTFVLVKKVLWVTVKPVKVNENDDQENTYWTKTLVKNMNILWPLFEMFAEFAETVVSPSCSLLFCLQQIKLANI